MEMNITQSNNRTAFQLCFPSLAKEAAQPSISTNGKVIKLPSTQNEIECHWFRSIHDLPDIWSILDINDYFLQKSYLSAVETYPSDGIRFLYLVFYKNDKPVGFAIGQILSFNGYRSFNSLQSPGLKETFNLKIKRFLAHQVNFNLLIIGNLLVTGEHGFHFQPNIYDIYNIGELLHEATSKIIKSIPEDKIAVTLFKEYFDENLSAFESFHQKATIKWQPYPI